MGQEFSAFVGANIAMARRRQGIQQRDFAKTIKVSTGQLSDWERGRNLLRLDALATIAKALKVSSDRLLLGEEKFWRAAVAEARKEFDQEAAELRREIAALRAERRSH